MSTLKVNTIQDTTGNDALTIDSSGNVTASQGFVPSTQLSHRNMVINGAMQIAQRGTSSTSTGYGSVDRFHILKEGLGEFAFTQSQSSTSPDEFSSSYRINTTTAESASGSGDLIRVAHKMEAQSLQHIGYGTSSAKITTLSFWVRSSVTGTYAIMIYRNDNTAREITKNYTISTADTWEYKTIEIPADTDQKVNFDNNFGMGFYWVLRAGSTFTATDNSSWSDYDYTGLAYGHTADWGSTSGDDFYITGVQFEVGSVATPFEHRSYGEELVRCQRYFQKTKSAHGIGYGSGVGINFIYTFTVPMRNSPSVSSEGVIEVSDWVTADYTQSSTSISINFSTNVTTEGIAVSCLNFSGLTNNRPYAQKPNSTNAITFDAEL